MDIEKKTDLISFINDESKTYEEPNLNKIFKCFCKCFCKTLKDIRNKFKDIEGLDIRESLVVGSNMIYHIYWLLIGYANNLKLTIFLTERAILLFTEFIIMSRDPKLNKDIYFTPNITDAVAFAYKKTIGPIKMSSFSCNNLNKINCIKNASSIIKHILQECYIKILENDNNLEIENINDNLYYILLNIFVKSKDPSLFVYVFDKTILIFDEFSYNLTLTIVFWKIFFDILSEFLSRGKNLKSLIIIMEKSYLEFTRRIFEGNYNTKDNFNLKMIRKLKLYTDFKLYVSFQFRKK